QLWRRRNVRVRQRLFGDFKHLGKEGTRTLDGESQPERLIVDLKSKMLKSRPDLLHGFARRLIGLEVGRRRPALQVLKRFSRPRLRNDQRSDRISTSSRSSHGFHTVTADHALMPFTKPAPVAGSSPARARLPVRVCPT